MNFKVLASGSQGNCTYLEINNKKFLIDIGISYLKVKEILSTINVDIKEMDYILITHLHNDHIKGLQTLLKNTKIMLLIPKYLYDDIKKITDSVNKIILDDENLLDNIKIDLIHISHDVLAFGYLISYKNKELVYITDTGYINRKYINKLKNKDVYIIESNHDEEMLMNGPYPYVLKQRVIGDQGHLSNKYTGNFLLNCIGDKTKLIVLAHISQHNNTYELALKQVKEILQESNFNLNNIIVAKQEDSLELIEV